MTKTCRTPTARASSTCQWVPVWFAVQHSTSLLCSDFLSRFDAMHPDAGTGTTEQLTKQLEELQAEEKRLQQELEKLAVDRGKGF